MKIEILIGIGIVIVIIVLLVLVLLKNLGTLIKTAVNLYGPGITKTDVRLGNVEGSLFHARAELIDFYIGNPVGFASKQAMKVGSILVSINKSSLTSDIIIIDSIELISPEITYEKSNASDNFKTILNNIKESADADRELSREPSGETKKEKKIFIRNFVVKDGKVNLVMSLLGTKTISAPLPDIHLKDLGRERSGSSPSEIFNDIFLALYEKITGPIVIDIFNKGLKSMGANLDMIGERARKGIEVAVDKFKGLLGS